MKKRILFFIGSLSYGGAQRVVSMLSGSLAESGRQVEVVTYYDKPVSFPVSDAVKFTCIEKETGSGNPLVNLVWFRRYLKANCDVLVSFLASFNIFALVASAGLHRRVIVADRNDPRRIPTQPMIRKMRDILYRRADRVVVQTSRNKAYFSKKIRQKCAVIPNPIALGDWIGFAMRTEKRRKIVTVGRLMPQKNQAMLIEAFARLSASHPGYALYIFGEGPQRENLQRQAQALGVGDRVHLPGSRTDLFDELCDAELFVLCSHFEGMSNALIEAMCLGLPCISTRVSGAEDLIQDHVNGIVVDVGDTEALCRAMRELLGDEALRLSCARNAVGISERLSLPRVIAQWIAVIDGE